MKNLRLIVAATIFVAAVLFALLTYAPSQAPGQKCGVYRNDKTVTINSVRIKAEVAQSPTEREQGLSNRPCIEANQGMLFVFDKLGRYSFWMKDMRFAIDIVWIGPDGKVVHLESNIQPESFPETFTNKGKPAQYVLELQAGQAGVLGVELGTSVIF